jgi:hypothetical protein
MMELPMYGYYANPANIEQIINAINGGFDRDTELFLYIIYPAKSFPIQGGMYRYIRHTPTSYR